MIGINPTIQPKFYGYCLGAVVFLIASLLLIPNSTEAKVCQASQVAYATIIRTTDGQVRFKDPIDQLNANENLGATCAALGQAIRDARREYARLLKIQTIEHYKSEAAAAERIRALGASDPLLRQELNTITVGAGDSAEGIAKALGEKLKEIEKYRKRAHALAKGLPQINGQFPDAQTAGQAMQVRDAAAKEWERLKKAADQMIATGVPKLNEYKATAAAFQGSLPSVNELRSAGLVDIGGGTGVGVDPRISPDQGLVVDDGAIDTAVRTETATNGCDDAECELGLGRGKLEPRSGLTDGDGGDSDARIKNAGRLAEVVGKGDAVEFEGVDDEYKAQAEKELAAFDERIGQGAIKAHLGDPDGELKDEGDSVIPLSDELKRGKLALDVERIAGAEIAIREAEITRVEELIAKVEKLPPAALTDPDNLPPEVVELNKLRTDLAVAEQAVLDARYKAIQKAFPNGVVEGAISGEDAAKRINAIIDADPEVAAARAAYSQNPLARVITGTEVGEKRGILAPVTANELHLDHPYDMTLTGNYGRDRLPIRPGGTEGDNIPDNYNIRLAHGPSPEITAETKTRLTMLEREFDEGRGMSKDEYELERQKILDGVTLKARTVVEPLSIADLKTGMTNARGLLDEGRTLLKTATMEQSVENLTAVCTRFTQACGAAVYKDARLDTALQEVRVQLAGDSVERQYWTDVKQKVELATSLGGMAVGGVGLGIRAAAGGTGKLATVAGSRLGILTSRAMTTGGLAAMFGGSTMGVSNAVDTELFEANTLAQLKTDALLNGLDPDKAAAIRAQYDKVVEAQGNVKLAKGMLIADVATGAGGKVVGVTLDSAAALARRVRGGGVHSFNRVFDDATVTANLAIADDAARIAAMRNGHGLTTGTEFKGIKVGPDDRVLSDAEANALLGVHKELGAVNGANIGFDAAKAKYDTAVSALVKTGMPVEHARDAAAQCIRSGLCGGVPPTTGTVNANATTFSTADLLGDRDAGRKAMDSRVFAPDPKTGAPSQFLAARTDFDNAELRTAASYRDNGIQVFPVKADRRLDFDEMRAHYVRPGSNHGSAAYSIGTDGRIVNYGTTNTAAMPEKVEQRIRSAVALIDKMDGASAPPGKKLVVTKVDVRVWDGSGDKNPFESVGRFHEDPTPVEYIITENGPGTFFRMGDGRVLQACEGELCRIRGSAAADAAVTTVQGIPHASPPTRLKEERIFIKFSTKYVDAD